VYIKCVFELLSFMGTWVLYECVLLVLMAANVYFLVEMGCFEFSFL
jgi:hypothetical protein